MSLRGDGETSSCPQRLSAEGQSPVGGVDCGVGSGQAVPQLVPGVQGGGPGSEEAVGRGGGAVRFGDVAPHEEITRAEEERVTAPSLLCVSVRAAVSEPLAGVERCFSS